jgi:HAMP domain-containing protein
MPGSTETRPGPATAIPAPYIMSQLEDRIRADLNEIVSLALTSAEQTRGHVQAEVEDMQRWASVLLAAGMIVGLGLAIASALSITRPMARIEAAMRQLSEGRLDAVVTDHGRGDEIGSMARTLEVFRSNAEGMRQMEAEKQRAEATASASQKAALSQLATSFRLRSAILLLPLVPPRSNARVPPAPSPSRPRPASSARRRSPLPPRKPRYMFSRLPWPQKSLVAP